MSMQMEEAIQQPKPISMQRGRSLEGICEGQVMHHTLSVTVPSPPGTAPLPQHTFDMVEMPIPEVFKQSKPVLDFDFGNPGLEIHESPVEHLSPAKPAFEQLAEHNDLALFNDSASDLPKLSVHPVPILPSSSAANGPPSPTRTALSPRRMSISDLNLDPGINASIEETNITLDDIAQFIEGPDPADNKWICIYDQCNKRFGRKENIKSHVQTHLGDRQFRCDHCKKCFVRGHDLKRHAKIHTGSKPYPCRCGNSFARHDALTRHRQRGMCCGAFEGIQKKLVKRGRPRKHRPEMDDRLEKAAMARASGSDQGYNYASSYSGSDSSSDGSPPTEIFDNLSIQGGSPHDDFAIFGMTHDAMPSLEAACYPPDMFTYTPPTSPGYSTGNKPSPTHRQVTPTDVADMPSFPSSPTAHLPHAHPTVFRHSPPSLSTSHSASSPAADIAAYDFADLTTSAASQVIKTESRNDFDQWLDLESTTQELDPETQAFFDQQMF